MHPVLLLVHVGNHSLGNAMSDVSVGVIAVLRIGVPVWIVVGFVAVVLPVVAVLVLTLEAIWGVAGGMGVGVAVYLTWVVVVVCVKMALLGKLQSLLVLTGVVVASFLYVPVVVWMGLVALAGTVVAVPRQSVPWRALSSWWALQKTPSSPYHAPPLFVVDPCSVIPLWLTK